MDLWLLSDISTTIIALMTISNFILAYRIKKMKDDQQSKFADLLQAIVVSNIVMAGRTQNNVNMEQNIEDFKRNYTGKTPIFPEV